MKGKFDVVVVGKGAHGPFTREDGTKESYPYVVLNSADGEGEPVKATLAQGLTWEPELFKPATVELELRQGGKLRCHGPVDAARAVRAA